VRTPMGGRRGYGPTHSQTLEKLFLGTPGLRVLAPFNLLLNETADQSEASAPDGGTPTGDKGAAGPSGSCGAPGDLLLWAILSQDDPVIFIENKVQYLLPLLDETALADFEVKVIRDEAISDQAMRDQAIRDEAKGHPSSLIRQPSTASFILPPSAFILSVRSAPPPTLTLAAYGYMAELARQAQLELAYEHEIFTELVVLTQLAPFELGPVLESAGRTHRLLVVEEGARSLGWGAEVAAQAAETLGAGPLAVRRLAGADRPVPASPALEQGTLPDMAGIVQMVKKMV
jgi:pyruvate/2-oxoglutarate/acetoin dehydrogenase E1 component